jgi:GIY-YIG catalytic domain
MTCGIYQLTFPNSYMYIGQSVNIENRWKQHRDKLETGKAAKPMQQAYNISGYPTGVILLECHEDHLDMMESMYIHSRLEQLPAGTLLNSSIPKPYSEADVKEVIEDSDYLKLSIVQLIRKVKISAKNISTLEDDLDDLKDSGIIAPKEIKDIRNENCNLKDQVSKLITINQELSRRANMSWFERLFS